VPALGRDLLRALAGTDVVPRLVAEQPQPEWRLGPLTFVVGPRQARLRYAREPVGTTTSTTADAIAAAWRKALDRLRARSLPPEQFLPRLAAAYATVLAARGGPAPLPDGRAPLVDVRAALESHTRAQFAWDVARLRRERSLVFAGRRVDLGVATGHAAQHRSRVVWIEDDAGSGTYYEWFRMIAQEGP
jgi:hypothetical protein